MRSAGATRDIVVEMPAEFDEYSHDYEKLVTDPLRTSFVGGGSAFFHKRKWICFSVFSTGGI
jgi:hypothetical protein